MNADELFDAWATVNQIISPDRSRFAGVREKLREGLAAGGEPISVLRQAVWEEGFAGTYWRMPPAVETETTKLQIEWTAAGVRLVPMASFRSAPEPCRSTHGGAGYCTGSYWDGDAIVCGACGARIEHPRPVGRVFVRDPGWWAWLLDRGRWEPVWPDFIGGEQARRRAAGIPEDGRGG